MGSGVEHRAGGIGQVGGGDGGGGRGDGGDAGDDGGWGVTGQGQGEEETNWKCRQQCGLRRTSD